MKFWWGMMLLTGAAGAADWPQWLGPQRDGVWEEEGIVEKFPEGGPRVTWRTKIGGGYAGPSVVEGRVYVLDWRADEAKKTPQGPVGEERLLCLEAATGKIIWERAWPAAYTIDYASGPRVTPTVHGGLVHALGAEGYLITCDAKDGRVLWQHELKERYRCTAPTWGFAGHPLVWENLLICLVGGQSSTAVAFDRTNGEEKWRALSSKQAGYCPPTLITQGGQPAVFLWHGEAINALDPRTGAVLWTMPRETRYGVAMAQPLQQGNQLWVSAYWWGTRFLELPAGRSGEPEILWETERESDKRTTHLNALMGPPLLVDGHVYGVCSYGQLRCLDWKTGERKWETLAPTTGQEVAWGTAFLTRLGRSGHRFLIFNEKGELISARLTPQGYEELGRAAVIKPDNELAGRPVVWSHPAYADGSAFIRNDSELIRVELRAQP